MSLAAVSCTGLSIEVDSPEVGDAVVLHFRTTDVAVKGTVADNECESYMSHIDVLIYEYENSAYTPFHYERIHVSSTPHGTVSLHKSKEDFVENKQYRFYVIANSTLETEKYFNGEEIISHGAFMDLDQTDRLIHLSGVDFEIMNPHYPQQFLMDGVAYMGTSEPATPGYVVVNNPDSNDEVELNVVLRRAAAKILLTIIPGDKVSLTKELLALSHGYLIRNMPFRSKLSALGGYPLNEAGNNPYWASTTISQSPYFQIVPVTDKKGNIKDGLHIATRTNGTRVKCSKKVPQW